MHLRTINAIIAVIAPIAAHAETSAGDHPLGLKDALVSGTPSMFVRSRYEHVEQDTAAIDKPAEAYTTRVALGYETRPWHGLSAFGQFEGVFASFDEHYNSGLNGQVDYPAVTDPDGSELNQAWVKYAPEALAKTSVKAGRQEISLDNQRFVGPVGWRQNWQSFDSATVSSGAIDNLSLFYGYLDRVHRVSGEDSPVGDVALGGSHLFNANYRLANIGSVTAYAYLIDFDKDPAGPLAAQAAMRSLERQSTQTYGARLAGPYALVDRWALVYAAEYAVQRDYGDHTDVSVDAHYALGELGVSWTDVVLKGGVELLSGSGDPGDRFTTPLATLHAFNGWADLFTNTPDVGLVDRYVSLGGGVPIAIPGLDSFRAGIVYHRFSSDTGGIDFGDELDLQLEYAVKRFDPRLVLGVKYADYHADEGEGSPFAGVAQVNVDTTKTWVYAQYSF